MNDISIEQFARRVENVIKTKFPHYDEQIAMQDRVNRHDVMILIVACLLAYKLIPLERTHD